MHFSHALYFVLATISTGVCAGLPPPGWGQKDTKCKKDTNIDPRWSMAFYSKGSCANPLQFIRGQIGRLSYTDSNYVAANQCWYIADVSNASKPRQVGSFHGVANGKYTITWYRGKSCDPKKRITSSSKGKYVKADDLQKVLKAETPGDRYVSVKVSHASVKGPFSRITFCGQKGVGKGYASETKQLKISKEVCAAVQKKCQTQKKRSVVCPFDLPLPAATKLDGDCHLSNPEQQIWYDEACRRQKGYGCRRKEHFPGSKIIACDAKDVAQPQP
jgi:hypothetical protein